MKNIKILGDELLYDILSSGYGYNYTSICLPTPIITKRKKYKWFGPIIHNSSYLSIIRVEYDIEDPLILKEELKLYLETSYKQYLDLQKRKEEINRGELI